MDEVKFTCILNGRLVVVTQHGRVMYWTGNEDEDGDFDPLGEPGSWYELDPVTGTRASKS